MSVAWLKIQSGQGRHGRGRWWVAADWRDRLFFQGELRWEDWRRGGLVEVVKQSVHRAIYRIALPEQAVFIKHYPVADWRAWLRQRLRPAKAWSEWRKTLWLAERSVPTLTPLAAGVLPSGDSYFVSAEIPSAITLYDFVRQMIMQGKDTQGWRQRRHVARELGRFLAGMHKMGVFHRDLHPWNILLSQKASGERQWYLIDSYAVPPRVCGELDANVKSILQSFSLLGLALWPLATVRERLACWRAYSENYLPEGLAYKDQQRRFWRQLDEKIHRDSLRSCAARAGRCLQTNREFYRFEAGRWRGWASRDISRQLVNHWVSFLGAGDELGDELKRSRHARVTLRSGSMASNACDFPESDSFPAIVVKEFRTRGPADAVLQRWRGSPARHCFAMAYRLHLAYVDTARPLAAWECRVGGKITSSFLVTEYVADAVDLLAYWEDRHVEEAARRDILLRFAQLVRRMHHYHLSHRDLKVVNVLVQVLPGQLPRLVLVDLKGVRYYRRLTRSRRIKDMARLALSARIVLQVSRTQLLRMLLQYLAGERATWRDWWNAIVRQMGRKQAQNQRRGRVLS